MVSYSPLSFKQYISPYLHLARLHTLTGALLVFFPCAWGVAAAAQKPSDYLYIPLFLIGAIIMRSAGCTLNDIFDRNIDKHVTRTKNRPIASGRLSVKQGLIFISLLCLFGLIILFFLPPLAIVLSLLAVPIAAVYPLMKRFTNFPQLILGFCFNSGALIGYATITHKIDAAAILLYIAGIFWTLGYDTIYGHQDKRDDVKVGVKSMALLLGKNSRLIISLFYTAQILCFAGAGFALAMHPFYYIALLGIWILLMYQILRVDLDKPEACMRAFKANPFIALLLTLALML